MTKLDFLAELFWPRKGKRLQALSDYARGALIFLLVGNWVGCYTGDGWVALIAIVPLAFVYSLFCFGSRNKVTQTLWTLLLSAVLGLIVWPIYLLVTRGSSHQ